MKFFWVALVSFSLIFQQGNTVPIVGEVLVIYESAKLIKSVYSAAVESSSLTEFGVNVVDPDEKHQKHVESKLEEIQTSLTYIKKSITEFSADLKRLEFSVDIKHFNSQVKYRTKQIFHSVQRFFEHPSNSTRHALMMQCHINPPNSILEVLQDILSENWLIDQSRHFKYESPALKDLIKKLDKIVEILAISEAACAGMNTVEDAKYDFKKLIETLKNVNEEVNRSKAVIHKTYLNLTRTVVEDYILKGGDSLINGVDLISDLMKHFETKYNYGTLYTIVYFLDHENRYKTFDNKDYGNLQSEFSYHVRFNNRSVLVIQSPSLCHLNPVSNKMMLDSLIEKCSIDNSLTGHFSNICGTKYSCTYIPSIYTSCHIVLPHSSRVISNGGICGYGSNKVEAIITKPMPDNFIYKTLKTRRYFGINLYRNNETHFTALPNLTNPVIFDPIEYIDEKLFMEQNFNDMFSNKNVEEPVALLPPFFNQSSNIHPVLISYGGNKEKGYSNFLQGYRYYFYGTVICENGNSIGEDAVVKLIEVDPFFDDTITSYKIDKHGYFFLTVGSEYRDFGYFTLELKLKFEDCCGHYLSYVNGFLIHDTVCQYRIPK